MIECVYLYAKVRKKRTENSFNSRKRELSLGKRKNGGFIKIHRFFSLNETRNQGQQPLFCRLLAANSIPILSRHHLENILLL